MPNSEADELIGKIADATVNLINSNMALVRRIAERSEEAPSSSADRGPVQDAWMSWAESAGDLVTISYLAAQLADILGGFSRPPSAESR